MALSLWTKNPLEAEQVLSCLNENERVYVLKTIKDLVSKSWYDSFGVFSSYYLGGYTPDWSRDGIHHFQWNAIIENRLIQKKLSSDEEEFSPDTLILNSDGKVNNRIVIEAPRDSAKSTKFTVHYPIWELYRNSNQRIVLVSNTSSQAKSFLREIKDHLKRNDVLINELGTLIPKYPDIWTQNEITVKRIAKYKDASISAVGAGGSILSRRADILICFPGYTRIELKDGSKKIRDVCVGDMVKTHLGNFKRVTKLYRHKFCGDMLKICTKYQKVVVTKNHPFFVGGKWIRAKNLKIGDRLTRHFCKKRSCIHFPKGRYHNAEKRIKDFEIYESFAKWLGFYVAEGCTKNNNTIAFTFNSKEKEYIKFIRNVGERYLGKSYIDRHLEWATSILFYSSRFAHTLRYLFGSYATTKCLPELVFRFNDILKANFLFGLFMGDAHICKNGAFQFSSASKKLRNSVVGLLKTIGISATCLYDYKNLQGTYGKANSYRLYVNSIDANKIRAIAENDYVIKNIQKVENYTRYIYNLEVEGDNSYIANGFNVHNCDDILRLENTRTEEQRIKVKEWFNKVLLPILVPNGRLVFVGTVWHPVDLIEEMMADPTNDIRVRYKAILDFDNQEVLWPERYSYDTLIKKRDSPTYGRLAFNMSYQNEVSDDETSLIKYSWVKDAKLAGSKYKLWDRWNEAENPFDRVIIVGGVDLAISQSITADYFAFVTLAIEVSSGKRIVLDIVRERLTPSQQRALIADKFEKFKHSVIMVESNAYQAALVKDMQEYTSIPIKSFITSEEKYDPLLGINSIAVLLENKKFVIPSDFSDVRTKDNVGYLCDGLITYRPDKHTEDTVMALWFANTAGRKLEMTFSKEEYEVESNLFNFEKV